jgi:NAD(P)-dependent dehydrogenase (short-subunit alcohol dehydrogenase family)
MPLLRAANDASVVFSSDRVGRRGLAYWGAFSAAKFGIEGLTQVLAEETRDSSNIRVNSIDPGPVRTAQRRELYPGEDPNTLPPADAVVPAYLWLLGKDSLGTTGQALSAQPVPK